MRCKHSYIVKSFFPVILFLKSSLPVFAQTVHPVAASAYKSFGAYSYQYADVFSFVANQASLAQINTAAIAFYGERRFMLNELNSLSLAAGVPTSSGNFGLQVNYSGFSEYNETKAGIAYGRKLGEKIDIGVQFNYSAIRISSYGNAGAVSFEAGGIFHITDKFHFGIHANNPAGGRFGKGLDEKLATVLTGGFGYEPSEKFFFSLEIQKEEEQPVNINGGFEYRPVPAFHFRAGISSATSSFWGGAGFTKNAFRIDATAMVHPQLGITPGLLFLFNFKKPER